MGLTIMLISNGAGIASLGGAILSMGMFSFSPLIWQYAITAEVFPLNTFFAALLIYLVVQCQYRKSTLLVALGAFICGLALCNQHTIILYEIPLVVWILLLNVKEIRQKPQLLVIYGGLFLLGFSLYAYLPIASTVVDAAGGWGHVKTITGFLNHILRSDYGTFQLYSGSGGKGSESFMFRSVAYMKDLYSHQGLYFSPLMALYGVCHWCYHSGNNCETIIDVSTIDGSQSKSKGVNSFSATISRKKKTIPWYDIEYSKYTPVAIAFAQFFYFGVFHSLSNLPLSDKLLYGIHQRFWMQPNVVTFIWVGIGFNAILDFVACKVFISKSVGKQPQPERLAAKGFSAKLAIISVAIALLISFRQYSVHYEMTNQRDNVYFNHYARAILDPLPQNAVLFVNYDMQWTAIRYVQQCEGFRKDVTSINLSMMSFLWFKYKHSHYPNLIFPGTHYNVPREGSDPFTMFSFLEANKNLSGVFLVGKLSARDKYLNSNYEMVPFGLATQFIRSDNVDHPLLNADKYGRANLIAWQVLSQSF